MCLDGKSQELYAVDKRNGFGVRVINHVVDAVEWPERSRRSGADEANVKPYGPKIGHDLATEAFFGEMIGVSKASLDGRTNRCCQPATTHASLTAVRDRRRSEESRSSSDRLSPISIQDPLFALSEEVPVSFTLERVVLRRNRVNFRPSSSLNASAS